MHGVNYHGFNLYNWIERCIILEKYAAVLSCKGAEYKTFINQDIKSDDELTFCVNGIKISVEFGGNLYIENYADYKAKQLVFLTFYEKNNTLFLTGYCLTFSIPITIIDKVTNDVINTFISVEMRRENTENIPVWYLYQLLNAKSTKGDIYDAIKDLQSQLSNLYIIKICSCCKYGQENPYGGDVYLNYLCFKKNKHAYLLFSNGALKSDYAFFMNKQNAELTRLFYSCEDFKSSVSV